MNINGKSTKSLFIALFLIWSVFKVIGQTAPSGLMCELLAHPELTVITDESPEFSWIVNSGQNNDLQTAFEIQVGTSADFRDTRAMVWKSGKVASGESTNVSYKGKRLNPGSTYYWRVRTWDISGNPSAWSDAQRFNTGDFAAQRKWPGESRWISLKGENGEDFWSFENRHPISYHKTGPVKDSGKKDLIFFDFGRSAFAVPEISYEWNTKKTNATDTLTIFLGEKAVGDSIDQKPGGGVLFRKYTLAIYPGKHTQTLDLPRFVPRYPHSQAMPAHMPEVIPFRFMEIRNLSPDIKIQHVTQNALYYHFDEESSSFSCSDARINAIYDLCRYSVKANTFNGDYAASERERMMYEADCYIHQMSHYAVDREFAIARYSLENMIYHATWPTEWIFHTVLMAYADYLHTGNTEIIENRFSELSAKLMTGLAGENGLISTKTGKQSPELLHSIHFNGKELRDIVDWPHGGMGLVETNGETDNYDFVPYNTVVNAFYYRSLVCMAEMAEAIGKETEVKQWKDLSEKVYTAFQQAFFNKAKGIYTDGIGSDHSSLHANMFPLCFGLIPETEKPGVIDFIKSKGMACGVYGANYLMEALFNEGETDYALSLLTSDSDRSWLNMIRVGATMTTEAWDNRYKSNNGWSHAWSASPAHIIPRKIMGIEPGAPGFAKIRIAPQPGHLTQAQCKLPTIRGSVLVEFKKSENEFVAEFTIPVNTTARFIIPPILADGKIMADNMEIKPKKAGNEVFIETGSGNHTVKIIKTR